MKSDRIRKLLKLLVTVVGIGFGSVLAFVVVQLNNMTGHDPLSLGGLLVLYGLLALVMGVAAYFASPWVLEMISRMITAVEKHLDDMSFEQMMGTISGLVGGMIVAALLSQLVMLMGASMFTVSLCAILFVVFGLLGGTLGMRRAAELHRMVSHFAPRKKHRVARPNSRKKTGKGKLLDDTVLLDGRIAAVCRAGFLEGVLLISPRVEQELQRLADSAEENSRIRGEKGRETLRLLESCAQIKRIEDVPGASLQETLLGDARKYQATLMTCDAALVKAAEKAALPVRNLNDLACALRPAVQTGDLLTVKVTKPGREAGQGIGYLPDGTMMVIEGGKAFLGETVRVTVGSVLQTNAGRMIFARCVEEDAKEDK